MPAHERAALHIDVPGRAMSADAIHTNVRFKRNKAKGPNPLSVKKKRKREEPPPAKPLHKKSPAPAQQPVQPSAGPAPAEVRFVVCFMPGQCLNAHWRRSFQGERKRKRPRRRRRAETAAPTAAT